jgi:4-carboxymuconolactone decarboxylase
MRLLAAAALIPISTLARKSPSPAVGVASDDTNEGRTSMSREMSRERGQKMAERLGQPATRAAVPGLGDFIAEVVYGGIWDRPNLGLADRAICTLAVLSVLQRLTALKPLVGTALDLGLTPRNILEVFVQVGLYAGFDTVDTSGGVAHEVFAARRLIVPPEPPRADSNETLDLKGREMMAQLHGERAQQGYATPGNAITGELYPAAIRYGYGELWSRPGLDHRQRMLCALAAFTAMGLESQLRKFSKSALNVGLEREEVIEAVIQTAPYSGFPRALNGLAILSEVL